MCIRDRCWVCLGVGEGVLKRFNRCVKCNELTNGVLCISCYNKEKSKNIPTKEELVKDLMTKNSIVKLASKYGVSDNAYRKWLKKRGLPFKLKDIKMFLMSV